MQELRSRAPSALVTGLRRRREHRLGGADPDGHRVPDRDGQDYRAKNKRQRRKLGVSESRPETRAKRGRDSNAGCWPSAATSSEGRQTQLSSGTLKNRIHRGDEDIEMIPTKLTSAITNSDRKKEK